MKDLDGCDVVDGNGLDLGKLKDVLPTGANDVFVVVKDGNEILIPALHSVVKNIDLEKKRIVVNLPPGLLDEK